jgi:hypothetical protein
MLIGRTTAVSKTIMRGCREDVQLQVTGWEEREDSLKVGIAYCA